VKSQMDLKVVTINWPRQTLLDTLIRRFNSDRRPVWKSLVSSVPGNLFRFWRTWCCSPLRLVGFLWLWSSIWQTTQNNMLFRPHTDTHSHTHMRWAIT